MAVVAAASMPRTKASGEPLGPARPGLCPALSGGDDGGERVARTGAFGCGSCGGERAARAFGQTRKQLAIASHIGQACARRSRLCVGQSVARRVGRAMWSCRPEAGVQSACTVPSQAPPPRALPSPTSPTGPPHRHRHQRRLRKWKWTRSHRQGIPPRRCVSSSGGGGGVATWLRFASAGDVADSAAAAPLGWSLGIGVGIIAA